MDTKIDFFEGANVDVKGFLKKIFSYWYLFGISIVLCVIGAFLFLKTAPIQHNVGASLLIRDENTQSIKGGETINSLNIFAANKNLENEMGIIRSFKLIRTTLNRLHFQASYHTESFWKAEEHYGQYPLRVRFDTTHFQIQNEPIYIEPLTDSTYQYRIQVPEMTIYRQVDNISREVKQSYEKLGVGKYDKPCDSEYFRFTISRNPFFSEHADFEDKVLFVKFHNINSMAESYGNRLSVENINIEATLVELGLEGVGSREVSFLRTHCEEYMLANLKEKNQMAARTIDFIDGQLFNVGDSLQRVQTQLESFQRRVNTIDLGMKAQNSMEKLNTLQDEYSRLIVKDEYYHYLLEYLQNKEDPNAIVAPVSIGINDPGLTKMIGELRQFNAQKVDLSYSTGSDNYDLQLLNNKIDNVRRALVENVQGIITSSNISIRNVERRIKQTQGEVSRLPKTERNMVNLKRRFSLNDNLYNFLLQKRAEAGIAIASNSASIKVVDDARIIGGKPSSPNKKLILALALALGLFIPLAFIILKDLWSDKITSAASVLQNSNIPLLAKITHANKLDAKIIYKDISSPVAESFRYLWLNMNIKNTGPRDKQVIGLSSYSSGEGKSFCASNLAIISSIYGKRVLLIEADIRRPSLKAFWNLEPNSGLSEYLKGNESWSQGITQTPLKNLDIMFSGELHYNPGEILAKPKFEELIEEMRERYDFIVIDAPPIGLVSDYILIGRHTDLNLLVVRENYSPEESIDELAKYVENGLIPNAAWLLNDIEPKADGYTYGYYQRPNGKSRELRKFWDILQPTNSSKTTNSVN